MGRTNFAVKLLLGSNTVLTNVLKFDKPIKLSSLNVVFGKDDTSGGDATLKMEIVECEGLNYSGGFIQEADIYARRNRYDVEDDKIELLREVVVDSVENEKLIYFSDGVATKTTTIFTGNPEKIGYILNAERDYIIKIVNNNPVVTGLFCVIYGELEQADNFL